MITLASLYLVFLFVLKIRATFLNQSDSKVKPVAFSGHLRFPALRSVIPFILIFDSDEKFDAHRRMETF